VCDDCSTDGTFALLQAYKELLPSKIFIYRNEINLGYSANFEKAIGLCTGDLIFLSDQDDIWFKNKIECIERYFINNKEVYLLIHDAQLVDERLEWSGLTKLDQVKSGYGNDDNYFTGALTAFRNTLKDIILPFPEVLSDHDIWIHLVAKMIDRRVVLPDILQYIRRHNQNTSDGAASSLKKINKVSVLLSQMKTDPANSYEERISVNKALQKRLKNIIDIETDATRKIKIYKNLDYLFKEGDAINNRALLINFKLYKRLIISIKNYISGDYKYFNGIYSLVRDVIR